MDFAVLGTAFSILVMVIVALVVGYALIQASLDAKHKRRLEVIAAERTPCPHLHYPAKAE